MENSTTAFKQEMLILLFVEYVCVFILGLIFGSLCNICIYRMPLGRPILSQPLACPNCGKRLAVSEMIPLLSFAFLRGRCRHCGAHISFRYPLTELMTAVTYTVIFSRYGFTVPFIAFIYLITILISIFFIDIDHKIIPDKLVIAAILGGIALTAYNVFYPQTAIYGDDRWWTPVAGFFSGSAFLLAVALLGSLIYKTDEAMGMGDVKLMTPIGLFLGWKLTFLALFESIILAGVTSILLVILKIKKRKDTIPFGPFIVTGAFISMVWGWNIINGYISLL